MPYNEASYKAAQKYRASKIKRVPLDMQVSDYDMVKAHAEAHSETVNGFIKRAISETMARDGGTAPKNAQNGPESTTEAEVVSLLSEDLKATQEAAEAATGVIPDKVEAAKSLFSIMGNLGAVDLDESRGERLGIVYLPPETLEAAQQAVKRTGETVVDFLIRAVEEQQRRDEVAPGATEGK